MRTFEIITVVNIRQQLHFFYVQYHHENCPDKRKLEIHIYKEETVDLNKFPIQNVMVPAEESWDSVS